MKHTIRYRVEARVTFTEREITEILSIGRKHYDGTCRAACVPGLDGFIYGLSNGLENGEVTQNLSFRQIDLMRKILEMSDPEETPAASSLFMPLKQVLLDINDAANNMGDGRFNRRGDDRWQYRGTGPEEDESEDAAVLRIIETDKSIAEAFARFVAEPMSVKVHLTDWEFKLACEAPIIFEKYKGFTWKQRRSLREIVNKIITGRG